MIERLDFGKETPYNAVEATIHLNRYAMAKNCCIDKKVLDVACGEGYGSYLLAKWGAASVDAIDIDAPTIEKARQCFESTNITFQCHTAEELPFESYSFDIVTSFETMEHLDNPEAFLQELRRVVKPDGIIFLSCPNDPYYYKEGTPDNPFHKRKYNYFEFRELAEKYLGNHVQYYLAFAVNGFLNMPISRSTEPGTAAQYNMLEMLNYAECSSALWVPQERYINHWNSNYYVGVWGELPEPLDITTAIFPRETFVPVTDEDIAFRMEAVILMGSYETLRQQSKEDIEQLNKALQIKDLEVQRLSAMLELLQKKISLNYQNMTSAHSSSEDLDKAQLEAYYNELCIIKSTKGYKLLNLIYRLRCKVRSLFKRS